jgi:hypothetical protein
MDKQDIKFSCIDDKLFEDLQGLINWFASRNTNPNNVMMSFDDIKQELEIELVKGIRYYQDKPIGERKKLLKTMLDHRVQELRYRYYKTHRAAENGRVDIETIEVVDEASITEYDSKEFIEDLKSRLSPTSREVLDAMLVPNDSIANVLSLASLRSSKKRKHRARNPWYIIRPWHVAEALGLDLKTCKLCFKEIRMVYNNDYRS